MSALKRSRPVIELCCASLEARSFHSIPSFAAKVSRAPGTLRRAKAADGNSPGSSRLRKPLDPEEALPPLSILQTAFKSGALDITPERALDLLRHYQAMEKKPSAGWERKLCNDYGISPLTLVLLSEILNRSSSNAARHLARKVMLSASSLGEKSATFQLIRAALAKKSLHLPEYSLPFQRLSVLAREGQDPEAMVVFGKVLYDRGKRDEALKWFRDARRLGQEFDGLAQALTSEGQILLDRNDRVGAEKLFRKAALELDDPVAYYVLSTLQLRGSPEEEMYLLKAASSGIVDACHRLGELEMEKTKMSQPKGTYAGAPVRDFKMAIEWWQVAAAAGHGRSMLSLATLYRAEGQDGQGLEWLEMAEKQPELKNEARKVRAEWASLKPS